MEKDNYQDDVSSSSLYVSDYRIQLNKKFAQKFALDDGETASMSETRDMPSAASFVNVPSAAGDAGGDQSNKRRRLKAAESKLRFKKNFATMLEEEVMSFMKNSYFVQL